MFLKVVFLICLAVTGNVYSFEISEVMNIHSPEETHVADLNGDGLKDLVAGNLNGEVFYVYLQVRKREFELNEIINLKDTYSDAFSWSFNLGHFDEDQNIDLIIFNDVQKAFYYKGNGDGSFKPGKVMAWGPPSDMLGIKVNLNNNLKDDLILTPNMIFIGNFGVSILENVSITSQEFKQKKFLINLVPALEKHNLLEEKIEIDDLAYGEFTGDGIRDLVIVSTEKNFFMILKGTKNGEFLFEKLVWTYPGPTAPKVLDLDNDGVNELILGHYKDKHSSIFFNENGVFRLQQSLETGKYSPGFHYERREQGHRMVVINYFSGTIKTYRNFSKTFFESLPQETIKVAQRARFLNAVDLDNDGKTDYVVTDFHGHKLVLLYGE